RLLLKEECGTELDGGYIFIGSIVLCDEKIKEQAQEIGHSEERERNYLIVHGLLHLFGYDHIKEKDKKEMREKENEIIALLYPEETEEQGEKN
ncbi:MAG: rRNA maturation RNase YbeY, partial [Clostridia bacterium]|nr:rRNA maturation RNase YbeY [Clostridia bacterium]